MKASLAKSDRARSLSCMSDHPAPSSTPDPNTTPVVTPQPAPALTPAPIANLAPFLSAAVPAAANNAQPKGVPNPWANAKPQDTKTSGDVLPTGVMPRPNMGVRADGVAQNEAETERVERAERPTPNGRPGTRTVTSASATVIPQSVADAPTSPPVVASVVPRIEDAQTGPITKRQRAFFASSPKGEVSASRKAPLVPLPKRPTNVRPSEQVELSGGVLVIERTSSAWIATAAVAVAGVVIALILGLDASSTGEKLRAKEAEVIDLSKRVTELEVPTLKATPPAAAATIQKESDATPIAEAVRARLTAELAHNDARVVVDGAHVTVTLEHVFDRKGKLAKRAPDLIGRAGAALAALPSVAHVDVVAYSDGNAGRGKSEWGQSAARATNAARALAENAKALDAKKVSVVGKGAAPKGVSARRIELVVTAN